MEVTNQQPVVLPADNGKQPQPHEHHPSAAPAHPETSYASSDVSSPSTLAFPSLHQDSSLDTVPALPLSRRNTRKLTIDSSISLPSPGRHLIRRKPLSTSASASPIAVRYSSGEYLSIAQGLPKPEQRFSRSLSVDSPTVYEFSAPSKVETVAGLQAAAEVPTPTNVDAFPLDIGSPSSETQDLSSSMQSEPPVAAGGEVKHPSLAGDNPAAPQTEHTAALSQPNDQTSEVDSLVGADADDDPLNILDGYGTDSSYNSSSDPLPDHPDMSLPATRRAAAPPHLNLAHVDTDIQGTQNHNVHTPDTNKPLPKSPGSASKLGSFFGWGSPSSSAPESPEKGFSPIPSPYRFSKSNTITDASTIATQRPTSYLEAPKSYGSGSYRDYVDSQLATPPALSPQTAAEIEEMEDELKAISAELASSIRREMDLEDLVDRLQTEKETGGNNGVRRTSDYFSDSGYSSTKFSDYDQSKDEIEKIQRRAEQEQAQLRLELTSKLQDERTKRQQLDEQIQELSQKASQIDLAQAHNVDATSRVRDLEATCETLRRKLSEERRVKDNFEDLLSALKGELQNASNERDNLRDEVVPHLRARVEGLETQATELEKMSYETTKMQQELQALKQENSALKTVRPMDSISEDSSFQPRGGSRLSRSNSITGTPTPRLQRPPSLLSRSKSVKTTESREALSDRLKDVEEQRDALHRALKALLERQEHQNRENDRKIRGLEMEKDRLLTKSPQKAGFVKEVSNLRDEINTLRRRCEEALEQKWQVEKGLAGLKMDLDRAEQEIASLKSLLQEKDILIPEALIRSSGSSDGSNANPVTSQSLTTAYAELQAAYAESLERVKALEDGSSPSDEKTQIAMEKLEQALSSTISERELALQDASTYQAQLIALKAGEKTYLESERSLADELRESARRVEELATQVRQQLATNQSLRQRLSDTVTRGDAEQKANIERITTMQARLRQLEELVIAAQTASEERVARHEEEISALKDNHNQQLSRLGGSLRSPRLFPSNSPLSPLFASPTARSPRLSATRSGPAMTVGDETQVSALRERVAELERALTDADSTMEEVVSRMNGAQIEVLQLQEERDIALNQTRKLEKQLQAEKVKAFEERFKTLRA